MWQTLIDLPMKRNLSSKFKKFCTEILAVALLLIVSPMSSNATLLATGSRDSDSYRLGYAIASIMTLKSEEHTVYFEVIPSNKDDDEVRLLRDRVSDFALVDSTSAAATYDGEDGAKSIRGLAVVRHSQDRSLVLLTRADVAEDDVVEVIGAIFDNLDILVQLHESATGIEVYTKSEDHPFLIHPGAASYFTDIDQKPVAAKPEQDNGEDISEMSSVISDLSARLNLIRLEREALIDEVEAGHVRRQSVVEKLESADRQLETVTDERERLSDELTAAKRRLDSIEFQDLFEANETARAMRLRAEQSEARHQEAVSLAQNCVEAQTGRKDNAFEALAQIERLEAEVADCRAAENGGGN